jgi:hypothetical protein
MKIKVNKEYLEDLYRCICDNMDFFSTAVDMYISEAELPGLKEVLLSKVSDISYYLNRVYNPELMELKQQARTYYQTWLHLKDIDKNTAQSSYFEYLNVKRKIAEIENPF